MKKVYIDGEHLSLEDVINVARHYYEVTIENSVLDNIENSRKVVEKFAEKEKVVYGVTTGFGELCNVFISNDKTEKLQRNLIRSHACGIGDPLDIETVRAIMLLRANSLVKGFSGIRLSTIQTLIDMINKKVHPIIPEKGSLGASGDLAPLAHMVLPMIGEGEAYYDNKMLSGKEAMKMAGIDPINLVAKEGLALINGTQVMTAIGALSIYDSIELLKTADIISSLTFEALNGVIEAFDERVHNLRPHKGQIGCANNLRRILEGSKMVSHQGVLRVQDSYSLRCIPQVHGASRDAINYVQDVIEKEMNAVTDNPLIFSKEEEAISAGNFHGQPIALSMDFLAIALSEIANISERRIERLVNPKLSGLAPFLIEESGLNSGFMLVQYSAASLVSENKVLAHPASVDSIPSSANQEDHVSMGTISARKTKNILNNVQKVLAMEMLCACQAIDLRGNKGLGKGSKIVYDIVRDKVPKINEDRAMYKMIDKCEDILKSGIIVKEVEKVIGKLF
ncbi:MULTISPECIES: histidine ammonia-lyase [Petrotoga]|uniref:Histidine ammonia-lyase n=2 Tax=Petrotoga sibirica TaxID=156202 RepID=A0A4R8EEY8_9BACT|nr:MULTISPECIES: histidine ammonia-lyase [Petrotoga]POZ89213.1 histidine ammonia-lyase [Petrotoga sibirica DSM 13575]POZ91678.1 histidine ammonia-lyase [Petrotoga sp. SL27]TDX09956.1 histidine ammonia-lyase [Petrotoga sibirica]